MRSKFQTLLGFLVLGLLLWAGYSLLAVIIRGVTSLDPNVVVAIIAGVSTLVVSVLSNLISKSRETQSAISQELRSKKIPIYEELISTLFRILWGEKLGQVALTQPELRKFYATTTEKLIIWGSDGVLKAFSDFRKATETNPIEGLFQYEKLLLEIRKDLGHQNRNLKRGVVLRLFINDIDNYLPPPKNRQPRSLMEAQTNSSSIDNKAA